MQLTVDSYLDLNRNKGGYGFDGLNLWISLAKYLTAKTWNKNLGFIADNKDLRISNYFGLCFILPLKC
jgi:hypothetical protein